jgi:hypothetical protein
MIDASEFEGVVARGDADVVDLACAHEPPRDGAGFLRIYPSVDEFVAGYAHPDDRLRPHGVAYRREHLARKPRPPLAIAAVAIVAAIHQRGQEARQQHAMRHRDFDAIELAGSAALRRRVIGIQNRGQVFRRSCAGGALSQLRSDARGAQYRIA